MGTHFSTGDPEWLQTRADPDWDPLDMGCLTRIQSLVKGYCPETLVVDRHSYS